MTDAVLPTPTVILIKPCAVTNPTVEPVPTIKLDQRLLSLYLCEESKSVSGVDTLCLPNASVAVGGKVTDTTDVVEIPSVPVTGNGLLVLTGELLRLIDTCPVVPIPTVP
jgi:hypothetical protein